MEKLRVLEKIALKISHTRGWKDISEVRSACVYADDSRSVLSTHVW